MLNSKKANVNNTSKRFSFARNAIKIALLFVSLGILAPTPVQAENIASDLRYYSFLKTKKQTEVEKGEETKYSKEEEDRSLRRLENFADYFGSAYRDDGKSRKSEADLIQSNYIIETIVNRAEKDLGKYADKLEVLITKISTGYTVIFVNDEFLDIFKNSNSYTDELEKGFSNSAYAFADLQSDKTKDGKHKTEKQIESDKLTADLLKDYLITDKDMVFFYTEMKNKSEGKTSLAENEERLEKIARNLSFLIEIVNKNCQICRLSDEEREVIAINYAVCLLNKENGIDKTEEIYNPLNVSNKGKKQLDISQEEYELTF